MQAASAANLSKQAEGQEQTAEQAIEEFKETGAIGKKIEQVGQNTAKFDTPDKESLNSLG